MIDKKPFRVTNEQIRAEITCTQLDDCENCPFNGADDCDEKRGNDFDMYKDLLDARELIENQEALLKEMRKELEDARTVMEKYEAQLTGELFNDPSLNAIIEKTKDYAE